MKKNRALLIALVAILVLCLSACFTFGRQREPYTAYEIKSVEIHQRSLNTFNYTLESDIAPSDSAKVYITRYDRIDEDSRAIDYTVVDGRFSFVADVTYSSYFIHIVDGDKSATLPMTRPQMAPALTRGEGSCVLTYNFVNGTSWSSFCDPTGKSVYRSASTTFDESAQLVARNVNIFGVDSTTDTTATDDMPYYYVVLSAKNGIVKYVSAPLMTVDHAYSDLSVSMEMVDGIPMLKVGGRFIIDGDVALEFYSADSKLGKVLEIVGDRVEGKAGDTFTVMLDMSNVVNGATGAGIWYDIKLSSASGSLYDLSALMADMSETLVDGNTMFEFRAWNDILKLNYEYYDYAASSVHIEDVDGVPTLIIEGSYNDTIREIKLHADVNVDGNNIAELYWNNLAENNGEFLFNVPLTDLPTDGTPWMWFHIYMYKGNATVATSSNLLRGSKLSIGQEFTYNGVVYTIKAYQDIGTQLAIQAEAK